MNAAENPGVTPLIAWMLFALVLLSIFLVLLILSVGSRRFQRRMDHRWANAPSRVEWTWIGWRAWLASIVDTFRRGH